MTQPVAESKRRWLRISNSSARFIPLINGHLVEVVQENLAERALGRVQKRVPRRLPRSHPRSALTRDPDVIKLTY
jgi:hypothetical protein